MGGSTSVPLPRYSCCIRQQNPNRCKENHSSTPKFKGHRRNLSAAFNMADMGKEFNVDLMDINKASEEELMTLPAINRVTARNIVEYRKQIGGFKKVEDLALVSGVGATKMTHIRMEICVARKKSSLNSSPASSKVDLSIQDDISRTSNKSQSQKSNIYNKININGTNVFQLMKVKGLSQNLAENIVAFRDKKGPFRRIDDLIRVKGIRKAYLSAIRPYLTLVDDPATLHLNGNLNRPLPSQDIVDTDSQHVIVGGQEQDKLMQSCPRLPTHDTSLFGSQEDLISLYGPLARKSMRRNRQPILFRRNNRLVLRVASWNLQDFGWEKIANPGVKEVVAMTILESGLSIVAVQDLKDTESLQKLCDELNCPVIPNIKKWSGHRGTWECLTSECIDDKTKGHVGFIFDVSRGIRCLDSGLIRLCLNRGLCLDRRPFKAVFKVKEWKVSLINLDWQLHQPDTQIEDVLQAILEHTHEDADVIVLGNFNYLPDAEELAGLSGVQYKPVLVKDVYTDISLRNPEGSRCLSNIWVNPWASALFTDRYGVIREGLTSPWIPDGWGWGGLVSSDCPLWAEFYISSISPRDGSTDTQPLLEQDSDSEEEFVDAITEIQV